MEYISTLKARKLLSQSKILTKRSLSTTISADTEVRQGSKVLLYDIGTKYRVLIQLNSFFCLAGQKSRRCPRSEQGRGWKVMRNPGHLLAGGRRSSGWEEITYLPADWQKTKYSTYETTFSDFFFFFTLLIFTMQFPTPMYPTEQCYIMSHTQSCSPQLQQQYCILLYFTVFYKVFLGY